MRRCAGYRSVTESYVELSTLLHLALGAVCGQFLSLPVLDRDCRHCFSWVFPLVASAMTEATKVDARAVVSVFVWKVRADNLEGWQERCAVVVVP